MSSNLSSYTVRPKSCQKYASSPSVSQVLITPANFCDGHLDSSTLKGSCHLSIVPDEATFSASAFFASFGDVSRSPASEEKSRSP